MRIFYSIISILFLGAAAGCGGRRTEPVPVPASVPAPDSAATLPVYDAQPRDTGYHPVNARNFQAMVRKEFAYTATARTAPKRVLDSLKLLRDPQKFVDGITRYTKLQDSLARLALSRKYNISLDSLDKVIHKNDPP